jgi:tetratricopeptide (TPR) repeat protein
LSTTDELPSIAASRGLEPTKLSGQVRGELDWIVMKALEKDRDRRYETANGFAADVQRYLADEQVQACPPSAGYRFQKFARRNKAALLTATLISTALILGTVVSTWQAIRASRAEAESLAQANEARQSEALTKAALEFVEEKIFAAAGPEGQDGGLGRDVTLRQALEAALQYVEASFSNQPIIEARLRMTLGVAFMNLGDADKAAEQFQKSRILFSKHLGPDDSNTLKSMGNLAASYMALGRHSDALKLHQETFAQQKAKLGPGHENTLATMGNLALDYASLGRHAEALEYHEKSLDLQKEHLGPDHPFTLSGMHNLATTYAALGRHSDAVKLLEDTIKRRKVIIGPDHPDTLKSMHNLAISYGERGRYADALKLYEDTLPIQIAKLGPDHSDTLGTMAWLAYSYETYFARHDDALKTFEKLLAQQKVKLGPNHPDTLSTMDSVARILVEVDRSAEALPIIDEYLKRTMNQHVYRESTANLIALRFKHFQKANDATGCQATVEMWESLTRTDADDLYNSACLRAITAAVVTRDPKISSADAARLAREEADRAMAWLKKAVAAGFTDAEHIRQDTDLDALRDREDFQKLLAAIQHPKEGK